MHFKSLLGLVAVAQASPHLLGLDADVSLGKGLGVNAGVDVGSGVNAEVGDGVKAGVKADVGGAAGVDGDVKLGLGSNKKVSKTQGAATCPLSHSWEDH